MKYLFVCLTMFMIILECIFFCVVQWNINDGKCGVCGDAYDQTRPRRHEAGGEYGRGIISRHYFAGQVRSIEIIADPVLLM